MVDFSQLENTFQAYVSNLPGLLPDGLIHVDLSVLQSLGLLSCEEQGLGSGQPDVTRNFHVMESQDRITLFNKQFVIWISPQVIDGKSSTLAMVAFNSPCTSSPELAFVTSGVYNTSRMVLRILERYLVEIQENEELLSRLGQAS